MREISLKINGKKFTHFNKFDITLKYNSVGSTFSFDGYFDPEDKAQRSLFKPLEFQRVQLFYDNKLFLTGTVLSTSTGVSNVGTLANISGYSLPGVLEDCPLPIEVWPAQFDNLSLKEITEKIIKPFKLKLYVDPLVAEDANGVYTVTNCESDKMLKTYLSELASQKNIVLSHDRYGRLVLTRVKSNARAVASYDENVPSTKITMTVNGQMLHSRLTAMKEASEETDTFGYEIVYNRLVSTKTFRPAVVLQDSGENNDTYNVALQARGSELRAIEVLIETDRWQYTDGKRLYLIQPNTIVTVKSPSNFINRWTRFIVEEVTFAGTTGINTAVLKCVLPECYTGENPKNIFA